MLETTEKLLDASSDRDVSTRAVCEAVGVGAPVLYRLFGDKNGLLRAVVDHGFERYLAEKRAAPASSNAVQDLREGWDGHIAFALAHPAVYRLMFSPAFATQPRAAAEALELVGSVLERCAAEGRLAIRPELAAQAVLSANIGVALNLVTQPTAYDDPGLSDRVRDAVIERVTLESPVTGGSTYQQSLQRTALQLRAQLGADVATGLQPVETALLLHWLDTMETYIPAS